MTEHTKTNEVFLPEMDLFAKPPIQRSVERSYEVQYRPISALDVSTFIDFVVSLSKDEYLLLNETYLHIKMQVNVSKDSAVISASDWQGVLPVNNLMHSMFKQVELEIGGKEVTMANSTYAYRAYLETLLGFSKSAKDTHLTTVLWYDDAKYRINQFKAPDEKD